MDAGNSLARKCAYNSARALASAEFLQLQRIDTGSNGTCPQKSPAGIRLLALGIPEFTHNPESNSRSGPNSAALERNRNEPSIGECLHSKSCWACSWPVREVYCRHLGLGHVDLEHRHRTIWEFSEPVLHGSMAGLVHGIYIRASVFQDSGCEFCRAPFA